jgi:hypothetical protein
VGVAFVTNVPERLERARRLGADPIARRRVSGAKLGFTEPEQGHGLAKPVAAALGRLQRIARRRCGVSRASRAHLDQRLP